MSQLQIRPPSGNWNWPGWETDPSPPANCGRFYGKIPNYLQSDSEGLEKERNHLQTLIDMELLQLEAKEQGIDRLPAFIYKIAQYRKEKLIGLYQIKKIKVRVSEQEVSDYFREQELARKVRFAQIITTSKDGAWSALREISSGRHFGEVAEQWSIHEPTMEQGGDTGRYVGKLDMPPYLRTTLFALEEGEVSQPIDIGGHFALFKALDSIETGLDAEQFQNIYRQLFIGRSVGGEGGPDRQPQRSPQTRKGPAGLGCLLGGNTQGSHLRRRGSAGHCSLPL